MPIAERRIGPESRGPYQRTPDDPVSCPSCGSAELETASAEGRVWAVCLNPPCRAWTIFRKLEGRLIVADRIPRDRRRAGQAAPPGAIGAAAG